MKYHILENIKRICIFLFILSFSSVFSQSYSNTLEEINFKGPVKSIKTQTWEAVDNGRKVVKGDILMDGDVSDFDLTFDEKGMITEKIVLEGGRPIIKEVYTYDEFKNLTSLKRYEPIEELILENKTTYEIKNKKVMSQVSSSSEDDFKTSLKTIFVYDNSGNLSEKIEYDSQGVVMTRTAYKYQNDKLIEEKDVLKESGYTYNYNAEGKIRSKAGFDSAGNSPVSNAFQYNQKGNKTKEAIIDTESDVIIMKSFDVYGNPLKIQIKDSEGNTTHEEKYRYKYDRRFNRIQETRYENGEPAEIIDFTIEYYED